jgi:hypothetical protein
LTTCGGDTFTAGVPGQIADLESAQIITRINGQSGAIDFGVAAGWNTGDADGSCRAITTASFLLGITAREPLFAASADGLTTVNYTQYKSVPILIDGEIFVQAAEATLAQDEVIAITDGSGTGNTATGALGAIHSGALSSVRLLVPGAVWLDTVASGAIGRVRIKTVGNVRTTT